MPDEIKAAAWDESYARGDNFLFYPNEEIIRFFARYVAKRTGPASISYAAGFGPSTRVLDFGCGIGRHVKYALELGLDAHGVDLSQEAISMGQAWFSQTGLSGADRRLQCGDGRCLPFSEKSFDVAVSHGVLDSMSFEVAKACMEDIARVLKAGSLFYLDLISGEDSELPAGFSSEVEVEKPHEFGTIQSYFDKAKIEMLLAPYFGLIELIHVRRTVLSDGTYGSRYHVIVNRLDDKRNTVSNC